jgi:hypothetical protein
VSQFEFLLSLYAFVAHVVSWFVPWSHAGHAPWTVLQAQLLLVVMAIAVSCIAKPLD